MYVLKRIIARNANLGSLCSTRTVHIPVSSVTMPTVQSVRIMLATVRPAFMAMRCISPNRPAKCQPLKTASTSSTVDVRPVTMATESMPTSLAKTIARSKTAKCAKMTNPAQNAKTASNWFMLTTPSLVSKTSARLKTVTPVTLKANA